jgi:TRAP-type C4-dicarboxylate transport system permease small subunit
VSAEAVGRSGWGRLIDAYHRGLRLVVQWLGLVAGAGLMAMVVVTTLDVVLRVFRISLPGAYDLVRIAGALTIAAALPYTTAVKGHVAIEYFFHKLGRRGRIVVDALMRLGGMALFGMLAWGSIAFGSSLRRSGEVSQTVQLPMFWVPYVLAASCVLVVLIKLYHLSHPGKPMLEP